MEDVRFSVIVPVYKVEKYLHECIDSVLSQTYRNIEIILVDDGSPDLCPKICDEYASSDERIKVIHKENGGLSSARNEGLKIAKGEYVIFLDSDDYYFRNDFFERINREIEKSYPDAVFFQRRRFIESTGEMLDEPSPYPAETVNSDCAAKLYYLSKNDKMDANACMKATKRNLITDNKLIFMSGIFSEDIEWFFRYAPCLKTLSLLNCPGYCYRIRSGSISNSVTSKNINDMFMSLELYAEKLRDTDSVKNRALLSYMSYQYYIILGLCNNCMSRSERKTFLKKAKKFLWLRNFSVSRKTGYAAKAVTLLGIKPASKILGLYIKNRKGAL